MTKECGLEAVGSTEDCQRDLVLSGWSGRVETDRKGRMGLGADGCDPCINCKPRRVP